MTKTEPFGTSGSPQSLRDCKERIPLKIPYNIFNRCYHNIRNLICIKRFHLKRTYEEPFKQFYIVMLPLKGRNHNINIVKGIFQKNGLERILITKETLSGAPHYNIIVTSRYDWTKYHSKVFKKFKCNVQTLETQADVSRTCTYVFKESKTRLFKVDDDYHIYSK